MPSPAELRFSETPAADQLTDVTYAAMKPVGTALAAGESGGEVESVKTTGDVYTAVAGEIIEVNQAISADPSLVNTDPYGEGWMVRIRTSDTSPLASLKDGAAYDQSLAGA
ncbi:MAG: glycine cleavage system protein H [Phycisphaerales bacterium]